MGSGVPREQRMAGGQGISYVLLVEDEKEKLKALERAAAGEGRRILTASARDEAERILSDQDQHVDLVVTDMALHSRGQDTDGLDVLRSAVARNIPVIVVSAYLNEAIAKEAMDIGAFDLIDRGMRFWEPHAMLRQKIGMALRYSGALRQAGMSVDAGAQ